MRARIHRRTLGALRREIEPVSTAEYGRFLFRWQHVAPASRLHGIDGTLHVIRQLEGLEIPAAAWEATVLPGRVAGYKPEYLDRLCYAGDVMWARLSPHPALAAAARPRRIRPTKLAPIALFARENAEALLVHRPFDDAVLSHAARDVRAEIERRGAPFFAEIVAGSKRLPAEGRRGFVAARRCGRRHGRRFRRAPRAHREQTAPRQERITCPPAFLEWPLDAPARGERGDRRRRVRARCSVRQWCR